jgi:hypothetical protein
MKHFIIVGFLSSAGPVAVAPAVAAEALVVHEWGTFTTVSGSDGRLLPGLEREEHALPGFVHSHAGFAPANKGWDRPVANVTVKMETPVLYFYAPQPLSVTVDVGFHGGSISQWYPDRSGGEMLPPIPTLPASNQADPSAAVPIDFAAAFAGSASWRVDVLARDAPDAISARRDWETPQWPRARAPTANKVRGRQGEVEGFIFYRGIGNFPLPLETRLRGGNLVLTNTGADGLSYAFVYEKRPAFPNGAVWWSGALGQGETKTIPLLKSAGEIAARPVIERELPRALERAGLTAEEARAMVATWRESYFEREGLRVFWIVPRALTDRVLPIAIAPVPGKLERVLVGRSEVLTPAFEQDLVQGFAADGGKRWDEDRYFLAYRTRARQLGVVLPGAHP